jgi:hypothetical protein
MDITLLAKDYSYLDLIGSDLCIDDILYKLTLSCPLGNNKCGICDIEKLKRLDVDKRQIYIMNMTIQDKLKLLSSHYHCYNTVIKERI